MGKYKKITRVTFGLICALYGFLGVAQTNVTNALGLATSDELTGFSTADAFYNFATQRSDLSSANADCFILTTSLQATDFSGAYDFENKHVVFAFELQNNTILQIGVEDRVHWYIRRKASLSSATSVEWLDYEIYDDLGVNGTFTFMIGHDFTALAVDDTGTEFKLAPIFFGMDSNLGTLSSHLGEFTGETSLNYTRQFFTLKVADLWKMNGDAKISTLIQALNNSQNEINNARFAEDIEERGVNESVDLASGFTVYPNPSKQVFYLDLTLKEAGKLRYEVFDLSGKSMFGKALTLPKGNSSIEINTQGELMSGTYLIELVSPRMKETRRVIVE